MPELPGIEKFAVFFVSSLILCLIPGVDMIFILGKTFTSNRRTGPIFAVFGITAGLAVHTCVVALGLGFFLAHSPIAFNLVRALGAAYLAYLGIGALRAKSSILEVGPPHESKKDGTFPPNDASDESWHSSFLQGLAVNLLNPKVVLFFLSYLPQFVTSGRASATLPLLILGGTFCLIGTLWNLLLVFAGNAIRHQFLSRANRIGWVNRISGAIFILLAVQIFAEIAQSLTHV